MSNILVVDDEKEIVDLIEIYLKSENFNVLKAYDGQACLDQVKTQQVDLIILDIMMPGMNGFDVCHAVRELRNLPIIMLSAKSEDVDKILGLGMGADDYMTKPFNPLELVARVKSHLRRYFHLSGAPVEESDAVNIKGLSLDAGSHRVMVYDRKVDLTPTEFDILFLLASHAGKVFSAEEIFERVWKEKYLEANNTVMVHIRKIREKIEENPRKPKFIKTVWGVGYMVE